jgi:hypothetical protein
VVLRNQEDTGAVVELQEGPKVPGHCAEVVRHQDATFLRRDRQHFSIGQAFQCRGYQEVYGRLPVLGPVDDSAFKVGVGEKAASRSSNGVLSGLLDAFAQVTR